MYVNGNSLLAAQPIKNMATQKLIVHGTSYGLGEAGYDIRIQQEIVFTPGITCPRVTTYDPSTGKFKGSKGRFILASAVETFQMPLDLVAMVADKSSWARQGLSLFNTVIEPGWNGILTLELVFHGSESVRIPAGSGIAQVLFARLECNGDYGNGKYQDATGIEQAKF